jgi:DNA polymerase III alpha subunit (gram-positive type)
MVNKINFPSFLDFEASSLSSNSYPIEVAWSLEDGTIESHLITPVKEWTDWSEASQRIHGIAREELIANGKDPGWISERMNEQLHGKTVYTDNPGFDGMWLAELFTVSKRRLKFKLGLVDELLFSRVYPDPGARFDEISRINEIKKKARKKVAGQHRAAWDVQYLIELYKMVKEIDGP